MDDDFIEALYSDIIRDNAEEAEQRLVNLSAEEREALAQLQINGKALAYLAETYNNLALRNRFKRNITTNKVFFRPLLLAVWFKAPRMTQLLLRHGADVNATSRVSLCDNNNNMTAIVAACVRHHPIIARILIQHGADVTSQDGVRCLANFLTNEKLFAELLAAGAKANSCVKSSKDGETERPLLHVAISKSSLNVVKLLIGAGADVFMKNSRGEDALQHSCRRGKRDVADFILDTTKADLSKRIDCYQLLGAARIDMTRIDRNRRTDLTHASSEWTEAIQLLNNVSPPVSVDYPNPNSAFQIEREPSDLDQLHSITSTRDGAFMYALALRERILGPLSYSMRKYTRRRAEYYSDTGEHRRSIDLRLYLLQAYVRSNTCTSVCVDPVDRSRRKTDLLTIEEAAFRDIEILCQDFSHLSYGTTREELQLPESWSEDALNVFKKLILRTSQRISKLKQNTDELLDRNWRSQSDLFLYFRYIYFLLSLKLSELQTNRFRHLTLVFSRACNGFKSTETLFYYLLQRCLTDECVIVLKHVLHSGADVTRPDEYGNTPFHYLALRYQHSSDYDDGLVQQIKTYADLLIQYGAHPDARNKKGQMASDILPCLESFNYETLQCLAARVLHALDYPNIFEMLPKPLADFVLFH